MICSLHPSECVTVTGLAVERWLCGCGCGSIGTASLLSPSPAKRLAMGRTSHLGPVVIINGHQCKGWTIREEFTAQADFVTGVFCCGVVSLFRDRLEVPGLHVSNPRPSQPQPRQAEQGEVTGSMRRSYLPSLFACHRWCYCRHIIPTKYCIVPTKVQYISDQYHHSQVKAQKQ